MPPQFITDEEMMTFEGEGAANVSAVSDAPSFIPDSEAESYFGKEGEESDSISIGGAKPQQYEGLLKTIVKDPIRQLLVKPAVRTAQAASSAIVGLFGSEKMKQNLEETLNKRVDIKFPFLGQYSIEAQKGDGEGVRQVVGDVFKSASYLTSGGRLPSYFSSFIKGKILKSSLSGAITGGIGGGLYGFGESVSQPLFSPSKVTYDTLFGAGLGFVGGGILGAALPIPVKGVSAVNELRTPIGKVNYITNKYREILNLPQRSSQAEVRFGKDTANFLATELPDAQFRLGKNNRLDTSEVIATLEPKYKAEEQAFEAILEGESRVANFDEFERIAITKARQQFKGTDQQKAITKVKAEIEAYKEQYYKAGWEDANGSQLVSLDKFNEIKRDLWSKTNFNKETDALFRDTNYLLGNTAKDIIENSVDDVRIEDLNKRLGDYAQAMKILYQRNGGVVKGGRLGQYFARTIGGTIGSVTGGIPGGLVGAITGDEIAKLMMNPQITIGAIQRLLRKVPQKERQTILKEAARIINEREIFIKSILKLPPKSFIPMGPETYRSKTVSDKPGSLYQYLKNIEASQKAAGVYEEKKLRVLPMGGESQPRQIRGDSAPETIYTKETFPRDKTLTGQDAILQEKSIEKYVSNPSKMIDEYIDKFNKNVNTDKARTLFADVGYKGYNSPSVQEASSELAKSVWRKNLVNNSEMDAVLYAGSSGSGKTSAVSQLIPDIESGAAAVLDGNLSKLSSAKQRITEAVEAGKVPKIVYVWREPVDAWINGVIKRMRFNKVEGGRIVPLSEFMKNLTGSWQTTKSLLNDGLDVKLVDNSLGAGRQDWLSLDKFNSIKFADNLNDTLLAKTKHLYESGKITKQQYDALIK